MTTSSDHRTPSAPRPGGSGHWGELTATLSAESTEQFGNWLSRELEALTESLDHFASPQSQLKSLGR